MAGRSYLDAWADALGVSTDADAVVRLAFVSSVVRELHDDFAALCDELRGLDERGIAARAAARLDAVLECLFWVKRDFLLHLRDV